MNILDNAIKEELNKRLIDLEEHFKSDVIFYYGPILPEAVKIFRDFIENLEEIPQRKKNLTLILNTTGGKVEVVEKFVDITRCHYEEVYFVVPDYALSAGTIFCMSGDKIFMDYSSSLGPIDPQVFNGKNWVPALGYLDQVEKLIEKAKDNTLTNAEFAILQNLDLATLSAYEQAKNLTITLLKEWLVKYKFRDWKKHKEGSAVTEKEKEKRAEEIANMLGDNKLWHSHGRMIGINKLEKVLKLKIEDYTKEDDLRKKIRSYNDMIVHYIAKSDFPFFLHSKKWF
ncbi:MAG TPA: serine dehydrogenasease [Candidatus Kapabacteria bacterium]|nr:serine dehydrogenasease [Candidatus Kapabacteria bacterium]